MRMRWLLRWRNCRRVCYEQISHQGYRFRLRARDGKSVGISEGYSSKMGCLNGIDSVRINVSAAELEE